MKEKSVKSIPIGDKTSLGIMQPYFFPYVGYFSLIKHTDEWIVFDDIQFEKQSWGNRNRILKHPEGLTYINVPLKKHSQNTLYSQIEIQNNIDWKTKVIRQLEYYRVNAPYYNKVTELIREIFKPNFKYLVDLNIFSMTKICDFLDIPFEYTKYSDLKLSIKDEVRYTGDWAFQISKKLNAKTYINPCMGHPLFHKKDWDDAGIKLKFLVNKIPQYPQNRNIFEEKLSIIDILMWNSKKESHEILDQILLCNAECLNKTNKGKVCKYDVLTIDK